ncbi:MAG: DNA methyltransferase [Eubacteriales bacterium]|nr:DNA methyltransferase [Eubacteriales bacterium]
MNYRRFETIPIDRKEIDQSELNIEIKNKSNIFTWRGQFSPQFVNVMLKEYAVGIGRMLDPFMGSGTTALEAAILGIDVCGIELNPAAYYLARMYELCNLNIEQRNVICKEIEEVLRDDYTGMSEFIGIKKVITSVLFMLNEENEKGLENQWGKLKAIILSLPISNSKISIINGDSRKVKLEKNIYDFLFTSPPYINVYNYHQQYRNGVEALGYNVLNIAVSEIGSNRKNRSNRFLTVIQYCIDITLLVKNILPALTDNARMIFVVGRSSKVLGISFSNSRLFYDILVRVFRCKLVLRQERYFKNKYGKIIYEDILHFQCNKCNLNHEKEYYIEYAKKIAKQYISEKLQDIGEEHERYSLLLSAYVEVDKILPSK